MERAERFLCTHFRYKSRMCTQIMHMKYWFILTNKRLISEDTLKSVRVIIATVVGCPFRYLQARTLSGASTLIAHIILAYCHAITYHKECLKFDISATTMDRHQARTHIYLCITLCRPACRLGAGEAFPPPSEW